MKSKCGKNSCIRIPNEKASAWLRKIETILRNNSANKGLSNNLYNEDVCYFACLKGKTPDNVGNVGMADATKQEICDFLKYLCNHQCYWVTEDAKKECCDMTGAACDGSQRLSIDQAMGAANGGGVTGLTHHWDVD